MFPNLYIKLLVWISKGDSFLISDQKAEVTYYPKPFIIHQLNRLAKHYGYVKLLSGLAIVNFLFFFPLSILKQIFLYL